MQSIPPFPSTSPLNPSGHTGRIPKKNKPRTCTHLLHSPSPPHHNRCRHHHSASRTNSHHLSLHTLKIPQIHGTNTIHQHYPPTLSTNTIHQHYPPTLSTNTIYQHYPPTLSTNTIHQHSPTPQSTPQSNTPPKEPTHLKAPSQASNPLPCKPMSHIVDVGASHGLVFVRSFFRFDVRLACLLPAWLEASRNLLSPINPKQ
jgi:hypothetical protein